MIQTITPNPSIKSKPGWCLAYVNEAFGVRKKYGSATAAWNGSATKHRDWNFPKGVWVPIWFSLKHEPNGHVALLAPDGSVWSTTHPTLNWPTRHVDIMDLFRAYAANNPLTLLGWTEDVEDTRVISPGGLDYASAPTTTEEDELSGVVNEILIGVDTRIENQMAAQDERTAKHEEATRAYVRDRVNDAVLSILTGTQAQEDVTRVFLRDRIKESSPAEIVALIPDELVQKVLDGLGRRITEGGK